MANSRSIHVVPSPGGGWSVLRSGAVRASRRFKTREEAIDCGYAYSRTRGAHLFIHRSDGTVQEKIADGRALLTHRDQGD